MTIREARKEGVRLLSSADSSKQVSPTPALDADCILCNILHTNRSSLLAHDEQNLSPSQYKAFCKAVEKRQTGLPVAYITICVKGRTIGWDMFFLRKTKIE